MGWGRFPQWAKWGFEYIQGSWTPPLQVYKKGSIISFMRNQNQRSTLLQDREPLGDKAKF